MKTGITVVVLPFNCKAEARRDSSRTSYNFHGQIAQVGAWKYDSSSALTTKWTEKYDSKIPLNKLINIAKKLEKIPENFTFQKQVGKIYEDRKKMTKG